MFANNLKEIAPSELNHWISNEQESIRIIDVRQMEEIAAGTIRNAEALPLHILPMKFNELSPTEKLVIICRSGARSAQACMFLQQKGYANVYNLRGGMMGWVQSGYPAHQPA